MAEYIGAIPAVRIPNLDELDGVDLTSVTPTDGSLLYFDGETGTWRVPTNNSKFFNEKAGNPFYVDDNNVTIKPFDGVPAGAQGNINGKTYELVDNLEGTIPVLSVTSLVTEIPRIGGFLLEDGVSVAPISSADISHWDTSSVTDMEDTFEFSSAPIGGWSSITQWDTSNVTNFKDTFRSSTLDLDIFDFWDFSSAEDLTEFVNRVNFYRDVSLGGSYDWSSFQPPSELKTLKGLFKNWDSFDLDFSNWDTSNITNFENAFTFSFSPANTPNPFVLNDDPNSAFTLENAEKIGGIVQYNSNYNTFDFSSLDFSPTGSLSSVRSLKNFFGLPESGFDASLVDVSTWDTSNITDISFFTAGRVSSFTGEEVTDYYLEGFNSDMTAWDTSSVENFEYAFAEEDFQGNSFNQDISGWDTSSAKNMKRMFWRNGNFNQPIGSWNVSSVTNMNGMFERAYNFDQDLSGWDVSSVTDFRNMFRNSNITFDPISSWDFSSAVYLGGIVSDTPVFDSIDWSAFVVPESVIDLSGMFLNAFNFNDDISSWDVKNVKNFSQMFENAQNFNQDLSGWDVSSAEDMSGMFQGANIFNQDISSWNVSNVTNMDKMFLGADLFNQDIGYWNTGNVKSMSGMFQSASSFNQDISYWNTFYVEDMSYMFQDASNFNQNIGFWDVGNVTDMESMFRSASSFNGDISGWDVKNVTSMRSMFDSAVAFDADITNWDVSNVRDMANMFSGTNFNQDISRWETRNLREARGMFKNNTLFNQSIGHWAPDALRDTAEMFEGATSFNQDISRWDMQFVGFASSMFKNATSFNQDISRWKIGGENFENDFQKNIGVENYNKLGDGSLQLSFVEKYLLVEIKETFSGASSFNQDITGWNWNGISLEVSIDGSGMSTANYDKILLKVHEEAERRENVKAQYNWYESWLIKGFSGAPFIDAGSIQHSSDPAVVAAKQSLEQDYGFNIFDGNP